MKLKFTLSRSRLLGIIIFLLIPFLTFAQTKITGTVTDGNKQAIPGASIKQKGTTNGTSSNNKGNFSLTLREGSPLLVISIVGYKPREVSTTGKTSINIELAEDDNSLQEVVAIGYQNIQRKNTAGAISSVKGKDFENTPYSTFDAMLQGRVAGLTVLSTSGEPGGNNIVNIRGASNVNLGQTSSPLYVIDGVIYDVNDISSAYGSSPLQAINPNDIESVDVLKDASASAVYGARAANGVIIVKTKRAVVGAPPQIRLSSYFGIANKPALKPIQTGAAERQLKMDLLYGGNGSYDRLKNLNMMLTDSLNSAFNNNTDWQGLFLQTGNISNIDASVAGATDKYQYRFSFNRYYEEGVMKGYDITRITPSLFFQVSPTKNLLVQTNLFVGLTKAKHGQGDGTKYPFTTWGFPSSFWSIGEVEQALYSGRYDELRDDDRTTSLNGNTMAQYTILPGLNLKSTISYNVINNTRSYFTPSLLSGSGQNEASGAIEQTNRWELENTLNYSKSLKSGHNFNAILLQGMERNVANSTFSRSIGNPDAVKTVTGIAAGPNLSVSNVVQQRSRLSWMGSFVYDYKGRYLFQAVYRADASSRYSENNRWGSFPSVSAGWNASEESFFSPAKDIVSYLKLRASYGITGNDPGAYYAQYQSLISNANYGTSVLGNGVFGAQTTYNGTQVLYPDYYGAASATSISWERSPQFNAGIDLGFFKDRISLTADYYIRDSKSKVFDVGVPLTTGYSLISNNYVDLRNTGIEFTLTTRNLGPRSKLQWTTNFNIAYNDNYIIKLPNGGRDFTFGPPWLQQTLSVGEPLFTYKVWDVNGIYSRDSDVPVDPKTGRRVTQFGGAQFSAGDPARVDQNGDYNIDYLDYVSYGNPNPDITGGMNNSFSYKGFSLDVLVTFISGRSLRNGYLSDKFQDAGTSDPYFLWGPRSGPASNFNVSDFWNKPGDVAKYPGLITNNVDKWHIGQSMFIEDASFLRIKNIRLGYALPQKLTKKLGLNMVRFYGVMDNVKVWSKSTVPDPEAVGADGYSGGNDYPIPKKYTFGIDLTF
ncbi:SusC/RagA family TonB-linked outer membrane protein [Pedobacter sp. MC2016-05]|uniref:SusC/RagA family TonB-linked outer membrane protein n=1 Tax=Pedobacter sp. MC2016-05 TaxID=2994474 RepID=UPI002248702E|nr:SusC/RagA family TonB-linked outer membrane protein [Pedobacter sp. MC2016-05]MCX2476268.1 SusC/RagA family TonB-linked outer membrane protein [Pedobacter sp. MC2016-05]